MSDSVRPHRWQPTRLPRPWDSPGKNTGMGCHFLLQCMKVKSQSEVTQSCPTLSDPMDYSPPGSSVHGIFQARVLEWGAIAFSTPHPGLWLYDGSKSHCADTFEVSSYVMIAIIFWLQLSHMIRQVLQMLQEWGHREGKNLWSFSAALLQPEKPNFVHQTHNHLSQKWNMVREGPCWDSLCFTWGEPGRTKNVSRTARHTRAAPCGPQT